LAGCSAGCFLITHTNYHRTNMIALYNNKLFRNEVNKTLRF
jgi:hypothetical protein